MAINVTSQTLHDGARNLVMQFTGVSDGSGNESQVKKVDVTALSSAVSSVSVRKITGNVAGGIVELYWDALTPVKFAELSHTVNLDYTRISGLKNNAGGGKNGDILLSTVGFELDSNYSLQVEMIKK